MDALDFSAYGCCEANVANLTVLLAVLVVALMFRPLQKELQFMFLGVLAAVAAMGGGLEFILTMVLIVGGVGLACLRDLRRGRQHE